MSFSPISITGLLIIGSCLMLYFLPTIIGWRRRNAREIFWLNFVIGWTALGWIIALFHALPKDAKKQVVINQHSVQARAWPKHGRSWNEHAASQRITKRQPHPTRPASTKTRSNASA